MWENVREITGRPKSKLRGNTGASCMFSADQLNAYYASISTDTAYKPLHLKTTANPDVSVGCFYEQRVFNWLDKIKVTSPGRDGLPFWLLKLAAYFIAKPVAHIYNLSIFSSCVPKQWKEAVITPIPKVPQSYQLL